MKIKGTIVKKFWFRPEAIDFRAADLLLARLTIGRMERRANVYRLTFYESTDKGPLAITIIPKGLFNRRYVIQAVEKSTPWIYKSEKWSDVLYGKKVLLTHEDKFDVDESGGKMDIYRGVRRIGSVRKVYESIFDKGEYSISFESGINDRIFLILASILIIETEVMNRD